MTDFDLFTLQDLEPLPDCFTFSDTTECSSPGFPRKRPLEDEDETLYPPGSEAFRKARKRRQNRESATRSRARKKVEVCKMDTEIQQLSDLNQKLTLENAALKAENDLLKKELAFYQGIVKPEQPKMKAKKVTGWLAVSVVLSVICMVFVTQNESVEGLNVGKRTLKSLKFLEGEETNYFGGIIMIFACITLGCVYKYFNHK